MDNHIAMTQQHVLMCKLENKFQLFTIEFLGETLIICDAACMSQETNILIKHPKVIRQDDIFLSNKLMSRFIHEIL